MTATATTGGSEVRDPPDVRAARQWAYLLVLLQETGVDPAKVPQDQILAEIMSPLERHGYTSQDIQNWISSCDPEIKPAWDEVTCFRAKVKDALKPPSGLGLAVAASATVAFLAAFVLARRHR